MIGAVWLYVSGVPLLNKNSESKIHMISNVIVAFIVASFLSLMTEMVTMEQLFSFQVFGMAPWLGMLLGVTSAQFYDKMNISNMYTRWYHKKR